MKALVTGISGQDGTYLARELLANGREVFGLSRGDQPLPGVTIRSVDYRNAEALGALLDEIKPAEIYHLASPSCIRDTLEFESDIFAVSVDATLVFLRWVSDRSPKTRFFFAGSSEIFGDPVESPQNEQTACHPENAYAVAKLAGRQLCAVFRKNKGVFASSGILFNHESPLRRADFVTRRITQGVAAIVAGERQDLPLGNLEAFRDWNHAADYTRAFRLILEGQQPADFVVASGQSRTVRDFCAAAFAEAGLDYRNYVVADPASYRPDFKQPRLGDPSRAREILGWTPEIGFTEMVGEMVRHDLALKTAGAAP